MAGRTSFEASVLSMLESRRCDNPITYQAIANTLNATWRTVAKAVHNLRLEPIMINGVRYHIGTSKRTPKGAFLERGNQTSRMLMKTGSEMMRTARRVTRLDKQVQPSLFEQDAT